MTRYPIELDDDDTTANRGAELQITPAISALADRSYPFVVAHDEGDGWIARVPDLPGLVVAGDTIDEMMSLLAGAKEVYIASLVRRGHAVPSPRPVEEIIAPVIRSPAIADAVAADGDA